MLIGYNVDNRGLEESVAVDRPLAGGAALYKKWTFGQEPYKAQRTGFF